MNRTWTHLSRITKGVGFFETELDGEVVLMHPDEGKYLTLRESAAVIWKMLDTPMTVAEMLARLCEIYEVSPDQCQTDLIPYLDELADLGVIDVATGASPSVIPPR